MHVEVDGIRGGDFKIGDETVDDEAWAEGGRDGVGMRVLLRVGEGLRLRSSSACNKKEVSDDVRP